MYSGEYINIIDGGIQGPPGTGMPAGGLKDEILTKKSDANYDYEWKRFKTVLEKYEQIPVSYTHLDVYKRQLVNIFGAPLLLLYHL